MKLTDEQCAGLYELFNDIFMDGYRMGQRDMRERAAKEADAKFARIHTYASENSDRYIAMRDAGHAIATTIRSLSVEES